MTREELVSVDNRKQDAQDQSNIENENRSHMSDRGQNPTGYRHFNRTLQCLVGVKEGLQSYLTNQN